MKPIASRANPLFRQLFKLQGGAGRRGEPAMLDGVHLCEAWLDAGRKPLYAIFDEQRLEHPALAALIQRLPSELCVSMPPGLLAGLASVDTGQGVIFIVRTPVPELPTRIRESVVLLDRIQDPGNVGTILRTCAAAGVRRIIAATGTAALWSPKVLRSGQGAQFALELHEHADLPAVVDRLDIPLIATALDGAVDLFSAGLPAQCAWVFGHEGQGVDAALLEKSAMRVRIDHERAAVESLNVAVAAGICLFEQRRQHRRPT
jgi:TrmH family RNA methyltransferase